MRIYLTVLLPLSLLLFLSSCHRSGVSNTSNPKKYQNNAAAGSSRHRGKNREREREREKEKKEQASKPREHDVSASDQAKKIIKAARSYTGTPYKLGGTSRSGMDCSGLTSLSYQAIDITLPRTSLSQSTAGSSVSLDDIQPGDLVFFSANKNSKKITHVGLVTEVTNNTAKFIHASTKLGVVENDLLSGYYYPLIVKVRRVL